LKFPIKSDLEVTGGLFLSGKVEEGDVPWARLTSVPTTASRWPTWGEVEEKPSVFEPAEHDNNAHSEDFATTDQLFSGSYTDLDDVPSTFSPSEHGNEAHDEDFATTGQLFSGSYNDLDDVPSTFEPSSHDHSAGDITSGTLSTSRIPTITHDMTNFANQSLNTSSNVGFNVIDIDNRIEFDNQHLSTIDQYEPSVYATHSTGSFKNSGSSSLVLETGSSHANRHIYFIASQNPDPSNPTMMLHNESAGSTLELKGGIETGGDLSISGSITDDLSIDGSVSPHLGNDAREADDPPGDWPRGISTTRNTSDSNGFPCGSWSGVIFLNADSWAYGLQFNVNRTGSGEIYVRSANDSDTWNPWEQIYPLPEPETCDNPKIYVQSSEPSDPDVGDIWFET